MKRLVLDDHHIGADLIGDLLAGGVDQRGGLVAGTFERRCDLRCVEPFERTQEKCDARTQSDGFEISMRADLVAGKADVLDMLIDRAPNSRL